ncbi:MAG: aminotransferase class I/II-fold pyridoxal phosphate-dependent enzyme [bacterium]|nr:aminotransferase class I/II-fold pyridoxal phosphate-dependent enzyme [bacterium]
MESGHPLSPVIVPSSAFAFESQEAIDRYHDSREGFLYARYGNPTIVEVEGRLAALEGAERSAVFSSGMAAITTTLLAVAGRGARIAIQRDVYGGTIELAQRVLSDLGMSVDWLGHDDLLRLEPGRIEGCGLLLLETPVNPTLRVIDLDPPVRAAREAGVPVVVDATFATPILHRPLGQGVDLVVHSATKYLGGHGDLIAGVVSGSDTVVERIADMRRVMGGILDPFPAYLLHRGLRTLAVRMEAHCRAAAAVARMLADHPRVASVSYPGLPDHPDHEVAARQMDDFGGMIAFEVDGTPADAVLVHDRLRLFARAGSLGDVESLVSMPARMSHRNLDDETRRSLGIPQQLLRLSVGLEDPRDLIADLEQALAM